MHIPLHLWFLAVLQQDQEGGRAGKEPDCRQEEHSS